MNKKLLALTLTCICVSSGLLARGNKRRAAQRAILNGLANLQSQNAALQTQNTNILSRLNSLEIAQSNVVQPHSWQAIVQEYAIKAIIVPAALGIVGACYNALTPDANQQRKELLSIHTLTQAQSELNQSVVLQTKELAGLQPTSTTYQEKKARLEKTQREAAAMSSTLLNAMKAHQEKWSSHAAPEKLRSTEKEITH